METKIRKIIPLGKSLLHLLYPYTCAACGHALVQQEDIMCLRCEYSLPQTNFHLRPDNPLLQKFGGKIQVEQAASLYPFGKSSEVQQLIHHLKYSNWGEIGVFVGKLYGHKLKESPFAQADLIIPVPLHPAKLQQRGYNQSEMFGQGLSESLGIKLDTTTLVRRQATDTQTRKTRIERWLNTKTVFALNDPATIAGKHILLVDDVITTGSTIEGCATKLLAAPGTTLSILCIAGVVNL